MDLQGPTLEETLKGVCELSQPLSYSSGGLHLITGVAIETNQKPFDLKADFTRCPPTNTNPCKETESTKGLEQSGQPADGEHSAQ